MTARHGLLLSSRLVSLEQEVAWEEGVRERGAWRDTVVWLLPVVGS